jgi:glutathione S-transferase
MIIVEFIADIYPDALILPKDPVERAKARFFVDAINKLITAWIGAFKRGEPFEDVVKNLELVQKLLPDSERETYAIGDFSIADIAGAPFFGVLLAMLEVDHAALGEGTGRKMYEMLQTDPKYAKLKRYVNALKNRESFKAVFDEVRVWWMLMCPSKSLNVAF